MTDLQEAADLYLQARLDYEHCRRQHEADPDNEELQATLSAAFQRRRKAWVTWLNLARPSRYFPHA